MNSVAALALVALAGQSAQADNPPGQLNPPSAQVGSGPNVKDEYKIDIMSMRAKYLNRVSTVRQSFTPPAGFPLPVYSFNNLSANFVVPAATKFGPAFGGTLITKDPPENAYKWYKQYLSEQGWTIQNNPPTRKEQAGQLLAITATKDKQIVMIACLRAPKGDSSIINISAVTKSSN